MKKVFLTCLILMFCSMAFAQLERKVSVSVSAGIPFIKSAGTIQAENIYTGYTKLPYFKASLHYNFNYKLGAGPAIGQFYSTKPNYRLTITSVGIGIKYNILPFDKKISPFIYIEGDALYITVSQKANSVTEFPENSDNEQVTVTSQVRNYPEIQTGFSALGACVGAGFDFTLSKRYTLFVAANYFVSNASKTFTSKNNFEDNTSELNFLMVQTGLRFSFGQKKSLY